ncbi:MULTISPECIES: hypothetical protein [Sphingomonas]|uniref:hypothetical protein n=1 Tax=Sphingomonas TaxID=13687 RepID=UPI00126A3817|nr:MULTISPECIES: hypothetical protein [Sphingomonas]
MRRISSNLWSVLVSFAAAITVVAFVSIDWWHPYCDNQADGPGSMGYGFPLPYKQASTISSVQFEVHVPVYLLDTALVVLPIFALLRMMWGAAFGIRLLLSGVFVVLAAFALWLTFAVDNFSSFKTRFSDRDAITSYRPAFAVDWHQHERCDW